MRKYQISFADLDSRRGVEKLERDGFTRHDIINAMYKHTDGASREERTAIVEKVYDRTYGERVE